MSLNAFHFSLISTIRLLQQLLLLLVFAVRGDFYCFLQQHTSLTFIWKICFSPGKFKFVLKGKCCKICSPKKTKIDIFYKKCSIIKMNTLCWGGEKFPKKIRQNPPKNWGIFFRKTLTFWCQLYSPGKFWSVLKTNLTPGKFEKVEQ